jgi:hypothetical protein
VAESEEVTEGEAVDIWECIRLSDGIVMYRVIVPPGEVLVAPRDLTMVLYYHPDDYEWRKVEK